MYYYGNLPYYKNSQELTHEAYFSLKELFHRFSHVDLKKYCQIEWPDIVFSIYREGNWDLHQLKDMPSNMADQ